MRVAGRGSHFLTKNLMAINTLYKDSYTMVKSHGSIEAHLWHGWAAGNWLHHG